MCACLSRATQLTNEQTAAVAGIKNATIYIQAPQVSVCVGGYV